MQHRHDCNARGQRQTGTLGLGFCKGQRQTDRQSAASSPSPRCRASGRLSFLPCPSHQPTWFGPNVLALGNMPFCRCLIEPSATVWAEYKARVGSRCNGGSSKGCDSSLQHSPLHRSRIHSFIHVFVHSFDRTRNERSVSPGLGTDSAE